MKSTANIVESLSPLGLLPFLHGSDAGKTNTSEAAALAQSQSALAIDKQLKEAEQRAAQMLDKEAIVAIEQAVNAVHFIENNKPNDAVAAIERARGKIDVLLPRNSATALIPVDMEVDVIDSAPRDIDSILDLAGAASVAIDTKDFPSARVLLLALMSEIRVRTFNLPLATFPTVLKDAARLLDQQKNQEAKALLLTALTTLVAVDHVTPLPLLLAREALDQAQAQVEEDKTAALELLDKAKDELQRSRELGYAGRDPEYPALKEAISKLEKQLKADEVTAPLFAKLKERLSAFLNRQSELERKERKTAA
jgi:hypothetical protein